MGSIETATSEPNYRRAAVNRGGARLGSQGCRASSSPWASVDDEGATSRLWPPATGQVVGGTLR